jgi:hypothetical protein
MERREGACRLAVRGHPLLSSWPSPRERNLESGQPTMDKDAELQKILGTLSSRRLEDVAEQLIALFRPPEWWEEAFEAQCGAQGTLRALQDADTRDAVKAWIRTLLTRAQREARQQVIMTIERRRATVLAGTGSPEEHRIAIHLYADLLQELRQPDGTAPGTPEWE